MTSSVAWFAGLTCDHLFADCPNRVRSEATLRKFGWWDVGQPSGADPAGDSVCGMCAYRFRRREAS